jgi:LacI family transcriptional regulator, repressor for deo operon, udp, cdd, tsx, nupC, and nupG
VSKVGIKDIATISGVSPATVSRTLRNPELVSKETRKRVMKAVKEAGYTPNRFGSSLRTQKSGNIMVVMPDITNQVNAGIIRAIESEAQKAGYSVLLGDTQSLLEREQHYAHMTQSGQADGILLFTYHLPFETDDSKPLMAQLPPLVNSCEAIPIDGINKVMIDNTAAAKTAVNHLLDFGHTRIAAVMGPSDTPSTLERLKGYKLALIEAGIDIDDSLIMRGDYGLDSGSSAMEKLLKLKQRPTAVFCFSDDMAIGAMSVLREYGFNIPQDISVMGFDDIRYAKLMSPALTTIHQPLEDIGKACTQLLLQQLAGKLSEATYIELPYTLMVRQSTGPVPAES